MATYYVSKSGNDANNGLGPDASHASNKPWLTIGKALGAAGIASGDTVYIGPGVYREQVLIAMTSAVAETRVVGDPLNAQGFKDGSGITLAAQPVRWTAFTTDDKTSPAATATLRLAGRDYLTFEKIFFMGPNGNASVVSTTTGASTNITFRDCFLYSPPGSSGARPVTIDTTGAPANTTLTWLFDRCDLVSVQSSVISITAVSSASADWDLGITIRNSKIYSPNGAGAVSGSKSGANAFAGGGVRVENCTFLGASLIAANTGWPTALPMGVYNCTIVASGTAIQATTLGQIVEDYNLIHAATARSNVTAGATSQTTWVPLMEWGQSALFGFGVKPFFAPTFDSPMLGFGSDASVSLTEDLLGRVRPSGPGITWANTSKAVGALELHDFGQQETSVVDAGSSAVKLTGPGDQAIYVPVDAVSTTITVRVRYDTNHGTGSKPQAILDANAKIGVSTETKTATVGVDTWESLVFSSFTATAKGVVRIRLISRSAAGNGIAYFDTLTVT
jgi:hypothetical protein